MSQKAINKFCALVIVTLGGLSVLSEGDGTFLVIALIFGGCLFFSKDDLF